MKVTGGETSAEPAALSFKMTLALSFSVGLDSPGSETSCWTKRSFQQLKIRCFLQEETEALKPPRDFGKEKSGKTKMMFEDTHTHCVGIFNTHSVSLVNNISFIAAASHT